MLDEEFYNAIKETKDFQELSDWLGGFILRIPKNSPNSKPRSIEMFKSGCSIQEISRILNLSTSTIRKYIRS
jgi:DNA-binding NarL/FixJ family response regulator